MTIEVAIRKLENISSHAVHTFGEEPFTMSLDDGIAIKKAIVSLKAWNKVINNICQYYEDDYLDDEHFETILKMIDKHLSEIESKRANCTHRHENGNCLVVGGFCTSVADKYCKHLAEVSE